MDYNIVILIVGLFFCIFCIAVLSIFLKDGKYKPKRNDPIIYMIIMLLAKKIVNYAKNKISQKDKKNNVWNNNEVLYEAGNDDFDEYDFFANKLENCSAIYIIMDTKNGSDGNASNNYKIGYSSNISQRLISLQQGNPNVLKVMHLMYFNVDNTEIQKIEKQIHKKLEKIGYKRRGEWFHDIPNLNIIKQQADYLKQHKSYFNESDLQWVYDAYKKEYTCYE